MSTPIEDLVELARKYSEVEWREAMGRVVVRDDVHEALFALAKLRKHDDLARGQWAPCPRGSVHDPHTWSDGLRGWRCGGVS